MCALLLNIYKAEPGGVKHCHTSALIYGLYGTIYSRGRSQQAHKAALLNPFPSFTLLRASVASAALVTRLLMSPPGDSSPGSSSHTKASHSWRHLREGGHFQSQPPSTGDICNFPCSHGDARLRANNNKDFTVTAVTDAVALTQLLSPVLKNQTLAAFLSV